MNKYKVADYTEEAYCDTCGRLLTVGDTVHPHGQHAFCSAYCKEQAARPQIDNLAGRLTMLSTGRIAVTVSRSETPSVSDVEMEDGQSMTQAEWDEYAALVVVENQPRVERKELRYQPLPPQRNMLDELEQPILF